MVHGFPKKGVFLEANSMDFEKKGVFIGGKLHGLIKDREEVELQWVFYPTSV